MPKVDKTKTFDFILGHIYDPDDTNIFPGRIKVKLHSILEEGVTYTVLKEANRIIIMDDDCIVGSCKCSNCNNTIEPWDKYCSKCGSKLIKSIINEVIYESDLHSD